MDQFVYKKMICIALRKDFCVDNNRSLFDHRISRKNYGHQQHIYDNTKLHFQEPLWINFVKKWSILHSKHVSAFEGDLNGLNDFTVTVMVQFSNISY